MCCELVFPFFICGIVAIICWGLSLSLCVAAKAVTSSSADAAIVVCRCLLCLVEDPPVFWDQVLCLLFTAVAWRCPLVRQSSATIKNSRQLLMQSVVSLTLCTVEVFLLLHTLCCCPATLFVFTVGYRADSRPYIGPRCLHQYQGMLENYVGQGSA